MILNNNFHFELITHVRSGSNSISHIFEFLKEKNFKKILLVLDKNLFENSKYIRSFVKNFKKKINTSLFFFEGTEEPSYQKLDSAIKYLIKNKLIFFNCIISIGGGSTIDFSKGLATVLRNPGNSIKYRGFPKKLNSSIPIIAIPSTAGTGAELAYNAVFTDLKTKTKLGINTKNNYPILSILDPKILINSPKKVIFNSGFGALVRSIDTLFNKKANKISKIFSINAFSLLFNALPKFLKNSRNLEYSSNMQWGAYMSVVSLLNSASGPSGEIAYYLSTKNKIPQGIGYGVAGLYFFKKNHEKGFYKYSELYELIEKKNKKKKLSKREKSKYVIDKMFEIMKKAEKFTNKINISKSEVEKITHLIKQDIFLKNTSNNPISLDKKDLINIVREIGKK